MGIKRVPGNLYISDWKMAVYQMWNTRVPQRLLPRFEIDPRRIVERVRGERAKLSGSIPIVRPFSGRRSVASKFYQIAGEPPVGDEPFIASIIPEGWINMKADFPKYLKMFREWD